MSTCVLCWSTCVFDGGHPHLLNYSVLCKLVKSIVAKAKTIVAMAKTVVAKAITNVAKAKTNVAKVILD